MKHLLTGSAIGVSALFCHGMIEDNDNGNILNNNSNVTQNVQDPFREGLEDNNEKIIISDLYNKVYEILHSLDKRLIHEMLRVLRTKPDPFGQVFADNDKEIDLDAFYKILQSKDQELIDGMLKVLKEKLAKGYDVFIRGGIKVMQYEGMENKVFEEGHWFFVHFYDMKSLTIACDFEKLMTLLNNINALGLEKISPCGCKFTSEQWLEIAKKLPNIRRMDLQGSNVDCATVVKIFKLCSKQTNILLGGCQNIGDDDIREIVFAAGDQIQGIDVSHCKKLTCKVLKCFFNSKNLEYIDLSGIPTTVEWIPYVDELIDSCKVLKKLRMNFNNPPTIGSLLREYDFKVIRAKGFRFYIDNLKLINKIGAEAFYEKKCKSNDSKIESKIEN